MSLHLILMLLGLACFVLAALGVSARVNFTPTGLALVTLALILN